MGLTHSTDVALLRDIVAEGSLSAAARRMGLSAAGVSMRLADLERRLGVALLRRTSKHLALTAEGEEYLTAALPALQMLETAEDRARRAQDRSAVLVGSVALSAPRDLGAQYVAGMVERFMRDHPRIRVHLSLTDEVIDVARSRVDLAVRYGEMPDVVGLVASTLAANHRVVCASPAYLDRVGRPADPSALERLNCLCLHTDGRRLDRWPVGRKAVVVSGDRSTNDGALIRRWAVEGAGVALKSWWDVREDVSAGRLEVLCPRMPKAKHPLRLVRAAGPGVPLRQRYLADHLRESFRRLERDDRRSA